MATSDNATPHKAVEYDRAVRQTIPFYEAIQSQTVDLVRTLKPDVKLWLDTGCGTGYLVELALSFFPKTTFILTDPSEAMLSEAVSRLEKCSKTRVRFLPPIPSESLDIYISKIHPQVITAILSHHYLKDAQRREATKICHGMLEENGIFITVENISPETLDGISSGLERWKRFQLESGRPIPVVEEHAKRFNAEYFPITIDKHLRLLREVGFKKTDLFWMSYMQAGFYAIK